MNTCDIIIPTYNDAQALRLSLKAIQLQHVPSPWKVRVLIADDGSTDNTSTVVSSTVGNKQIVYLPGKHGGIAKTRNRGLAHSQADIILFLGADIILRPGTLAAHCNFHKQFPDIRAGTLGFIHWDPRLSPTPLMEWMAHGGRLQNNFDPLLGKETADPKKFFYGSQVSCKRALLKGMQFSEQYTTYGYEDIDFGIMLAQKGLTLHILSDAIGLHHHQYTANMFFHRQLQVGKSTRTHHQRHSVYMASLPIKWHHQLQQITYPLLGINQLLRAAVRIAAPRWTMPRLFAHSAGYELRCGFLAKN